MEVLDKTGFRTWGQFLRETDEYERRIILKSIKQYHDERSQALE